MSTHDIENKNLEAKVLNSIETLEKSSDITDDGLASDVNTKTEVYKEQLSTELKTVLGSDSVDSSLGARPDKTKDFNVAIVGRPNVGKSSLFNVLVKSRKALVKNQPGVTRDLRRDSTEWWGKSFNVADTGGWTDAEDKISSAIRKKLSTELINFDHLVFVCDIKMGLTSDDKNFFSLVRQSGVPFTLVLNKVDSGKEDDTEFYQLGSPLFYKVSCEHKIGIEDLVEDIIESKTQWQVECESQLEHLKSIRLDNFEDSEFENLEQEKNEEFKITVIGRPNVGKSSLVNRILKREEQLVSDLSGTTTDALSFKAEHKNFEFSLFDTAGIRRHLKMDGGLEGLTALKAFETIERSNFILLVLDGTLKPSRAEARLIKRCNELSKPFLIVINKWDLTLNDKSINKETFKKSLEKEFHFLKSLETVYISALTGSGIDKLFTNLQILRDKLGVRIGTGELNRFFERVIKQAPTPFYNNRSVKLYYITQTKQSVPSFLCFANYPKGVTPSYRRFIENRIKENFDLQGVPVRVYFLPKDSSKRGLKFNG